MKIWHIGLTDAGIMVATEGADATTEGDLVIVRVSETYDLSTKTGKLGLIGIHTPDTNLIQKLYNGFFQNFRYFRFVSCDVALACASMLPADPLQIGVEPGTIAPQDMFNPILYTAVSNDSFNNIVNRIMVSGASDLSSVGGGSVDSINDKELGTDIDQFQLYYGLLADPDGWRKAMPQSGLEMSGLFPMVFSLVSNMGNNVAQAFTKSLNPSLGGVVVSEGDTGTGVVTGTEPITAMFRGPSMRMPRIPTMTIVSSTDESMDYGTGIPQYGTPTEAPKCYVGCIVMPPAKLNQLYYRMKVTWSIEFSEPRAITELASWAGLATLGQVSYGTDYAQQSQSMQNVNSMVDTAGTTLERVMVSGR